MKMVDNRILIAFILYLQTWLKEDEDIEEMPDYDLQELSKKWVDEWLPMMNSEHSGDCTRQPWSCMRCWFDRTLKFADRALKASTL